MKYIRPHLSTDIRAKIAPETRSLALRLGSAGNNRRWMIAGLICLTLAMLLTGNLFRPSSPTPAYDKIELASIQSPAGQSTAELPEKQVLGAATSEPQTPNPEEFTSYVVNPGDTLFNISQQYGISWDLIAQVNDLNEPYTLHAGQTLKIPQATTSQVAGKIYTIRPGETLGSIARTFNITISDIVAVNPNLQQSDLITVGQVIRLP